MRRKLRSTFFCSPKLTDREDLEESRTGSWQSVLLPSLLRKISGAGLPIRQATFPMFSNLYGIVSKNPRDDLLLVNTATIAYHHRMSNFAALLKKNVGFFLAILNRLSGTFFCEGLRLVTLPRRNLKTQLPSTLIRHENGEFWKRFSNRKNLKTPACRFLVDGKHFENGAFRKWWRHDNHVISLPQLSSSTSPNWPAIVEFLNSCSVVWTENIWCVFRVKLPF